jgi:hypothetical protein
MEKAFDKVGHSSNADLEDWKRAGEALHAREHDLRPIIDNIPGFVRTDTVFFRERRHVRQGYRFSCCADCRSCLPSLTLTPTIGPYTFIPKSSNLGWDKKAFDTCM